MDNKQPGIYRNIKNYYQTTYRETQLNTDLARKNRLQFCFPSNLSGKKIISIGSGAAVDIEFLIPKNEVHGVDIMEDALKIALEKGVKVHLLDLNNINQLPFKDNSFDIVIATDILEHLFDPMKILIEMRRILKESGFGIISVPNHFFWKMRLRILFGGDIILPFHSEAEQWDYFHIRFFNSKGFEKMLQIAGFDIVQRYYDKFINVPQGLPYFIDRMLARQFPDLFSLHFLVKVKKA